MPGRPIPVLEMQTGGWYLGDPLASLLGTSTFLTFGSYVDISTYLRTGATRRGRQHELDRIDAGTAVITLANRDGRFDPTNLASPYYPNVRPMVRMRLSLDWNAVRWPVFVGFVETWPQSFTRTTEGDAWVTVQLVDAFKVLNLTGVHTTRPSETTGQRIAAVLTAADWTTYDVDTGLSTVAGATIDEDNALSYLQTVAETEGGPLFVNSAGVVEFQDRSVPITAGLDIANDTWGDGGGTEKDYDDVVVAYDDSNIWNDIQVESPGHTTQTASNDASQGKYFRRTLRRSTIMDDENQMADRATYLAYRYAEPTIRISSLNLEPRGDDTQWDRILMKDLHDKVRVIKRPPGGGIIQQDSFIEGIRFDIAGTVVKVNWALSALDRTTDFWVLDESALDSETRLYW